MPVCRIIAIGDGGGRIKFYDNEMKVLYWIQKSHFDAIKSLSFNRNKTNFDTPSQTQNVSGQFNNWSVM